jgi:DNA repair exonuclease SbcCD ATPase subunit
MFLESIELVNFCNHHHRVENFQRGLTAVLGANGSGKSNFFNGIRWLLTGANANSGTKDENVSQYAAAEEAAFGKIVFTHGDIRATVTRHLRPDTRKSTLGLCDRLNNKKLETVRDDKKVNARIEAILDVSFDTLQQVALVAQEDIFGVLSATQGERAAAFQRLFRTDAAEAAYKVLGAHGSAIVVPEVAGDLDTLRRQLAAAQEAEEAVRQRAQALQPLVELVAAQREDEGILLLYSQQQAELADAQHLVQLLAELEAQGHVAAGVEAAAQQDMTDSEQRLEACRPAAERAKQLLADMEKQAAIVRTRDRVATALHTAEVELQQLQRPLPPQGYATVRTDPDTEITTLSTRAARYEQMLRDLAQTGRAECPTCHTPIVGGLQAEIDRARTVLPELRARLEALRREQASCEAYETALAKYDGNCAALQAKIADLRVQMEQWQQLDMPDVVPEQLTAQIQEVAGRTAEVQRRRAYWQSCCVATATLRSRYDASKLRLQQLSQQLAQGRIVDEHAQAARERCDIRTGQLVQRQELDQELVQQQALRLQLEADVARLQEQLQESRRSREWLQRITRWRDIVHWDALPRYVIQQNLQRLTVATNETLSLFQTDFYVTVSDDMSFCAHFQDGRVQSGKRLSHGQKVVLACAIRLALNLRLAPQVRLLMLDEPTAYLDKHHIRGFAPVLTQLRQLASSSGLQCIIVTHEDELAPLFDAVIQL